MLKQRNVYSYKLITHIRLVATGKRSRIKFPGRLITFLHTFTRNKSLISLHLFFTFSDIFYCRAYASHFISASFFWIRLVIYRLSSTQPIKAKIYALSKSLNLLMVTSCRKKYLLPNGKGEIKGPRAASQKLVLCFDFHVINAHILLFVQLIFCCYRKKSQISKKNN